MISEKYIQAGLYLASKDEKKSKDLYEEVILSNNKFYSILALNTILENLLEDISFEASDNKEKKVTIDRNFVKKQLDGFIKNMDLAKFIL